MPFQQVGDINIYYELRGRGYPLILIQGFSGFVYSNELIISPSLVSSVTVVISHPAFSRAGVINLVQISRSVSSFFIHKFIPLPHLLKERGD